MAHAAYEPETSAGIDLMAEGAIKFENKRTSTVAYLLRQEHRQWLIWRGTESAKDWIYNLAIIPIRIRGGSWIHGGFYLAHKSVWKDIKKELDVDKPLMVVGHSLGAALSETTVLRLKDAKKEGFKKRFVRIDLIAFGKPNLFFKYQRSKKAQLAFPGFKTQLSVVNSSDVVARVPRLGYRPALNQTQLWFGPDCDMIDPETSVKREHWDLSSSITDHGMDGYCSRMTTFCESSSVATLSSKLRE